MFSFINPNSLFQACDHKIAKYGPFGDTADLYSNKFQDGAMMYRSALVEPSGDIIKILEFL